MATLTATRPRQLAPNLKMRTPGRQKPSILTSLSRTLMRRPRRTLAVTVGLALATAIILNALVFQKARHPSPFLSTPRATETKTPAGAVPQDQRSATSGANAATTASVQAVLPPVRPANLEALIRETAIARPPASVPSSTAAAPRPAPRDGTQRETAARETAPRDPIAELIMNGDARPPALVGQSDSKRITLSAQKALARLGYGPVKNEGRLDDSTRDAIGRFEKDRKLPVTRELSPRTQRELAAASGLKIE
jgi:Putative peptidoglycan binding domain